MNVVSIDRRYFLKAVFLAPAIASAGLSRASMFFAPSVDDIRTKLPGVYAAALSVTLKQTILQEAVPSGKYWEAWIQALAETQLSLKNGARQKQAIQRIDSVFDGTQSGITSKNLTAQIATVRSSQTVLIDEAYIVYDEILGNALALIDTPTFVALSLFGAATEGDVSRGLVNVNAPLITLHRDPRDPRLAYLASAVLHQSLIAQGSVQGATPVFTDASVQRRLQVDFTVPTQTLLANIGPGTQQLLSTIMTADPQRIASDSAYVKSLGDAVNAQIQTQLASGDQNLATIQQIVSQPDSPTRQQALKDAEEEAKRTHDEIAGAITIGQDIFTYVFNDPKTGKAMATVADSLNSVILASAQLQSGKMGSLAYTSALLTAVTSVSSLVGGSPTVDEQILKAVKALSDKLDAFIKQVNQRFDTLQVLELGTLHLLNQALDELRQLKFDMSAQLANIATSLQEFENYERTANRDQHQSDFQAAVDHGKVLVQYKLQGKSIDYAEYNECLINLKTHAEAVSREVEFSGLLNDNMTVQQIHDELNQANVIPLAVGLLPQLAQKSQTQVIAATLPNPIEWAKGVFGVLQLRALFPEITNKAFDEFVGEFWQTGCSLKCDVESVTSISSLQAVGQKLISAFGAVITVLQTNIDTFSQQYGDALTLGPNLQYLPSDERTVTSNADIKVLAGRWETAPFSGPSHPFGYYAVVQNDPLVRAKSIGLVNQNFIGHEDNHVIFGVEHYDHYEIVFQKGQMAGAPAGPTNHIKVDVWSCDGNFGDSAGVERLHVGPVNMVPSKDGKGLLNYLQAQLDAYRQDVFTQWLNQIPQAVSGIDLTAIQQFGTALRLFAGLAVWQSSDDVQLASSIMLREDLILTSVSLLGDFLKDVSTALTPETWPLVQQAIPSDQLAAFQAVVDAANADAATKGITPTYIWSAFPSQINVKQVISTALTQKIASSVSSLAGAAPAAGKGLTIIDEALAQIAAFMLATNIATPNLQQPQILHVNAAVPFVTK